MDECFSGTSTNSSMSTGGEPCVVWICSISMPRYDESCQHYDHVHRRDEAVQKLNLESYFCVRRFRAVIRYQTARQYQPYAIFGMARLGCLAVHRDLKIFETRVHVWGRIPARKPELLEQTNVSLMEELRVIGKALIPGGVASRSGSELGWTAKLRPTLQDQSEQGLICDKKVGMRSKGAEYSEGGTM
jgi:hypothetical protein